MSEFICPHCKGAKGDYRDESQFDASTGGQKTVKQWHACQPCDGTGKVYVEDEAEAEGGSSWVSTMVQLAIPIGILLWVLRFVMRMADVKDQAGG